MTAAKISRHWRRWLAGVVLMGISVMAHAATQSYTVAAPDGVPIAVQETGNPQGQAIISDLKTHLDAERDFIQLCFATPPDALTFQRLLANAAMASENMQNAVHEMSLDAKKGLGAMDKPLLLIYGEADALVQARPSFNRAKALNPGVSGKFYAQSGHAPFLEEADRFNRDLANFVEATKRHS